MGKCEAATLRARTSVLAVSLQLLLLGGWTAAAGTGARMPVSPGIATVSNSGSATGLPAAPESPQSPMSVQGGVRTTGAGAAGAPAVPDPTPLAHVAAQVTPGTWLRFKDAENASWNGGALLNLAPIHNGTDNATAWSTKGMWNPGTREFYFIGGGHCDSGNAGCPGTQMILRYAERTNAWDSSYREGAHAYEGATVNTSTGTLNHIYFRLFGSNTLNVYNIAKQAWVPSLPSVPSLAGPNCCLALEYFPDRNSLITIDNDYGTYEYSFSRAKWSGCLFGTVSSVGCPNGTRTLCPPSSTTAPWARYDPVQHRLLLGGCTSVYALSAGLQLTRLASSPFEMSTGISGSPVTIDPATGRLISWNPSGSTYTSDGTSWVDEGPSPFPSPRRGGLVCSPVVTYEVVMCIYAGTHSIPVTRATVWLYRTKR